MSQSLVVSLTEDYIHFNNVPYLKSIIRYAHCQCNDISVQYYNSDTFLTYRHSANIILNKNKSLLQNIQKKLYQINIANTDLVTDFSLHNIKIMRENFTFLKKLFSFFFKAVQHSFLKH